MSRQCFSSHTGLHKFTTSTFELPRLKDLTLFQYFSLSDFASIIDRPTKHFHSPLPNFYLLQGPLSKSIKTTFPGARATFHFSMKAEVVSEIYVLFGDKCNAGKQVAVMLWKHLTKSEATVSKLHAFPWTTGSFMPSSTKAGTLFANDCGMGTWRFRNRRRQTCK